MGAIERQSAGGHDAMLVRVKFEFLIPGVEHTKEADFRAEMFGIASHREKGYSTGLQQEMVQQFLVLQGEWRQTKVTRKIFDRLDVAVDGSLSVITTLEFFEHHFAKVGHS